MANDYRCKKTMLVKVTIGAWLPTNQEKENCLLAIACDGTAFFQGVPLNQTL